MKKQKGFSIILLIIIVIIVLSGAIGGGWYYISKKRIQEETEKAVEKMEELTKQFEESEKVLKGEKLPEAKPMSDLPSDFPEALIYPGSELETVIDYRSSDDPTAGIAANFRTDDSVSEVYSNFQARLQSYGWEINWPNPPGDEGGVGAGFRADKGSSYVGVGIDEKLGKTKIGISLSF
ncbi:MAG: hypothetical protein GTN40_05580 [Candidatus Aenigmarchaeota archaeon]|nr:hypothetical protein [Candidatus Aenigmarchaeota archaeon]